MNSELKVIIFEEKNVLQELLNLLDEQYKLILSRDLIKIQKIANDIEYLGKNLANIELKRRGFIGEERFKDIINNSEDNHIKEAYESIKSILVDIESQKEINDTLIKQQLFFTSKMINLIKPSKNIGIYNSYGKVDR